MLKPAYIKSNELNYKMAETMLDPYYKFYHLSYAEAEIVVEESFWQKVQLVSVNKDDEVCGYFKAVWTRPENTISSISAINFNKNESTLFASDVMEFFRYLLFVLNAKKIEFNSIIGNPATPHYDSIVKNLGGRVIGTKKYEYLINDDYYDAKLYEIINDRWKCDNCGYKSKTKNGDFCKRCGDGKMIYRNPFVI